MTSREAFLSCRSFYFRELVAEYDVKNRSRIPSKILRLYWQVANERAQEWVSNNAILIADNTLRAA